MREPDGPFSRPGAFTRPEPSGMGTETEVTLLLRAMVKLLRPRLVVETGTFEGDTASQLGIALDLNGMAGFEGRMVTYETDAEVATRALRRLSVLRVRSVEVRVSRLQDQPVDGPVDFAFVDSHLGARMDEIAFLLPRMAPDGLLFVHDANDPVLRSQLEALEGVNVVFWPTPRGLALVQKKGA